MSLLAFTKQYIKLKAFVVFTNDTDANSTQIDYDIGCAVVDTLERKSGVVTVLILDLGAGRKRLIPSLKLSEDFPKSSSLLDITRQPRYIYALHLLRIFAHFDQWQSCKSDMHYR